jgi:hypothetical protein
MAGEHREKDVGGDGREPRPDEFLAQHWLKRLVIGTGPQTSPRPRQLPGRSWL